MSIEKKQPLAVQAYLTLKKKIIDLELRPGEILLVHPLSVQLGLSRTPVQEAIVRLTQEGLVEKTKTRKSRVAPILMEQIKEIYEIRETLESLAVQTVARNRTQEQIEELRSANDRMSKALKERDFQTFFLCDQKFHELILRLHGNRTLSSLMKDLNDHILRIRHLTSYVHHRLDETIDEHGKILDMIVKKDAPNAVHALQAHLRKVVNGLEELFRDDTNGFLSRAFLVSVSSSTAGR